VTYTPGSSYDGSDSFTFSATGPGGTSNTATIAITDKPPGRPPVCVSSSVRATGGHPKSIVLGCSGEVTSRKIVSEPKHGRLSAVSVGGRVTYTPRRGYRGSDSFTFDATGRGGTSNTARITIRPTVRPSNQFAVPRRKPSADGVFQVSVTVPGPGTVNVLVTAWNDNLAGIATVLQPARRRFAFARAHGTARRATTLRILVKPNARGSRLVIDHRYRVTLRLWVTYTPTGGSARSVGFYGLHLP
jgi:hypothetical protein